jgi:hypothetical protein
MPTAGVKRGLVRGRTMRAVTKNALTPSSHRTLRRQATLPMMSANRRLTELAKRDSAPRCGGWHRTTRLAHTGRAVQGMRASRGACGAPGPRAPRVQVAVTVSKLTLADARTKEKRARSNNGT